MTRQSFDAGYVERLARGDDETVRNFHAYFGELVRMKARSRRLTRVVVEDVEQETFLRVLRTLRCAGGLRTPECLGAFVNSVCNNVMRERQRDQKRHLPPAEEPAPLPDTVTPSPEERLVSQEATAAVRSVLERMSSHSRQVLRSVLLEERDRDEVCAELGVSPAYLRVLLYRAKKEFLALYQGRNGDGPQAPTDGPDGRLPPGQPPRGPSGGNPPDTPPTTSSRVLRDPRFHSAEGGARPTVQRLTARLRRPSRKALGL